MTLTPLRAATERGRFGGKASHLAVDLGHGLPVPDGFALDHEAVRAVARGALSLAALLPSGSWAVRSSAADEDGAQASFAGQHATVLGVQPAGLDDAVRAVHASAHTEAALAYRKRLGLPTEPRMAVVVQRLVPARAAAVVFTKHPLSGAREIVVEAAWGLGEAVVQGLVTPDSFRLSFAGELLERRLGDKDLEIHHVEGGTAERPVDAARARSFCLDDAELAAVVALVARVRALHDEAHDHDLEIAFDERGLHLLQRRRITR